MSETKQVFNNLQCKPLRVYVAPSVNRINRFTAMQREQMAALCEKIGSLSTALFSDWGIARSKKVALLNWYEDRVTVPGPLGLKFLGALACLVVLRLRVGKIIWFRHNFTPHYLTSSGMRRYTVMTSFLSALSDVVVTMRPCAEFDSAVVPHPLYSDEVHAGDRPIDFLWFGTVRPNKDLQWLLDTIKPDETLTIAGKCDDPALFAELQNKVVQRGLTVEWRNRFVPDEELEDLLKKTKFVVMTHASKTAVVSGTFFHAASFGANVIVRESDFAQYAERIYPFCKVLRDGETFGDKLDAAIPSVDIYESLQTLHGASVIHGAWVEVFERLGFGVLRGGR
jgi:beta-1,4-mannosyltransferase